MIRFDRLWKTMEQKKISTYQLREQCGIDSKTVRRLRANCALFWIAVWRISQNLSQINDFLMTKPIGCAIIAPIQLKLILQRINFSIGEFYPFAG